MAEAASLVKEFHDFGGVDYRSSDVRRNPKYASDALNAVLLPNGTLTCRKGFKYRASGVGGGGLESYVWKVDGVAQSEVITIDNNLWRRKSGTVTLAYTGAEVSNTVSIVPTEQSDETFINYCVLIEGETEVLSEALGYGHDEAATVTLADLKTDIDALANFSCTLSAGISTLPAAFLPVLDVASIDAGYAITFYYWEQVPCPTTNPFTTFYSKFNTTEHENACLLNHSDLLYVLTGYNKEYKYDSVACYASGLPIGVITSGTPQAGSLTNADSALSIYHWIVTYEHTDEAGNVVEGDASLPVDQAMSAQDMSLVIPTLQVSSERQTACAIVAGAQVAVNEITVDDGSGGAHTMYEGLTAYFYDGVTSEYVERKITATSATSITVAGDPVNVDNNAVISANLRINIYRNKDGGSSYYLVAALPNDSFAASVTYLDGTADASLGAEYNVPAAGHGEPPENMKYATVFQGSKILAGPKTHRVYRSDADGAEYYPTDTSFFELKSKSSKPITSVLANRALLLIQKENESHALTGDINTNQFRVDQFSQGVGCVAFHTAKDIDGYLWFCSEQGVFRTADGELPQETSFRIQPVFGVNIPDANEQIVLKRATAAVLGDRQEYRLYLPCEETSSGFVHQNANSRVYVADYRQQSMADEEGQPLVRWWPQSALNYSGGACLHDGTFIFMARAFSETLTAMEYLLGQEHDSESEYDLLDHSAKINYRYWTQWLHLGEPSVFKDWLWMKLYSIAERVSPQFHITVQTEFDMVDGNTSTSIDLDFGLTGAAAGWGVPGWGATPWGAVVDSSKQFPLLIDMAKSMRILFTQDVAHEYLLISGWEVEVVMPYISQILEEG
jgi:hypothetical protein